MRVSGIRIQLLLLVVFLSPIPVAAGVESSEAGLAGERPNAAGAATVVDLSLILLDVDLIDDVRQRFRVDLFFVVAWQDPRLALPLDERSGKIRHRPMDEIWTPRGLIVNDRGLSPQLPRVAEIDDLGNVTFRQRLSGELAADLKFKEFPFDTQRLPIDFVSYRNSPDEVRFSPKSAISGGDESFSVEGWRLKILEPEFGEFAVPAMGLVRPRLTFYIEAQRNTRYYLLTMFLPMSLIVFMSWTVFWLQPGVVPPRIAISTASIFSLMAFAFSIRVSLPRVSYMTRADIFVTGCTLLVFLALGVAVIGSRWASGDGIEHALRLNAVARWVYVALFCVVGAIALVI